MTAEEVEALLAAGEVWRLSQTRATVLAHAVRADSGHLLEALEAEGFMAEAAQVREALAGRLTEELEEIQRIVREMRVPLHQVLKYEPAWAVVAMYEHHPELRGALDLVAPLLPQHQAALDSWRAGHAIDAVLGQSQSTLAG